MTPSVFAIAEGVVGHLFAMTYSDSGAIASSLYWPAVVKQVQRRSSESKSLTWPLGIPQSQETVISQV